MGTKPSPTAEPLLTKSDRQAALSEFFLEKSGGQDAKTEQEERREAEQKRTVRLRALRLAKEAAEREAEPEPATAKAAVKA